MEKQLRASGVCGKVCKNKGGLKIQQAGMKCRIGIGTSQYTGVQPGEMQEEPLEILVGLTCQLICHVPSLFAKAKLFIIIVVNFIFPSVRLDLELEL